MSDFDLHGHSMMKTSPSILSKALTEPLSISNCSTLQTGDTAKREKEKPLLLREEETSEESRKKKREPLPYEVPSKALEVIVSESESKEDTSEKEDVSQASD